MIDLVELLLVAGDGGDGRVSYFRAKYITKGGPDGGDGGRGGDIRLVARKGLSSLQTLAGVKKIEAKSGQRGGRKKCHGANAEGVVIEVPVGTRVWVKQQNETAARRLAACGVQPLPRAKIHLKTYSLTKETDPIPADQDHGEMQAIEARSIQPSPLDHSPALLLVEMLEDGQSVLLCQGGIGGKGNTHFANSRRQTPLLAEYGQPGERRLIELELRLLADVGLVGLPNAGKSTLLSVLTKSRPKIAPYPFTTLEPNLGVLELSGKRSLVIADIPGLIAGASQGKGLGATFLRHVSHCQTLCFVLTVPEESLTLVGEAEQVEKLARVIWDQYQVLRAELAASYPELLEKPRLLLLSKSDLLPAAFVESLLTAFTKIARSTSKSSVEKDHSTIDSSDRVEQLLPISAANRQGLDRLVLALEKMVA